MHASLRGAARRLTLALTLTLAPALTLALALALALALTLALTLTLAPALSPNANQVQDGAATTLAYVTAASDSLRRAGRSGSVMQVS